MISCIYCNHAFQQDELLPMCCEDHQFCARCALQVNDIFKLKRNCYCCYKCPVFQYKENKSIEELYIEDLDLECLVQNSYNIVKDGPDSHFFLHKESLHIYINTISFAHQYYVDISKGFIQDIQEDVLKGLQSLNPIYMKIPVNISYDQHISKYKKRKSFNCLNYSIKCILAPIIDNLPYIPISINQSVINTLLLHQTAELNKRLNKLKIGTILQTNIQEGVIYFSFVNSEIQD